MTDNIASPFFLGLRTATYAVADLSAAKAWYAELLGAAPYFDEPFYVGFNVGGFELGLVPTPDAGPKRAEAGIAYWGVADAESAFARLIARGAESQAAVQDVGGGIRIGAVWDPFGNVLGIIENPQFRIEPARRFYHGTRADLKPGDMLQPGYSSNFAVRKSTWIYFSETLEAATWGAELAKGEGHGRIYVVEPTGEFMDDPNLTDKKFPGNPTKSYRSRQPLRVVSEVNEWAGHAPEVIQAMKDGIAGLEPIDD